MNEMALWSWLTGALAIFLAGYAVGLLDERRRRWREARQERPRLRLLRFPGPQRPSPTGHREAPGDPWHRTPEARSR